MSSADLINGYLENTQELLKKNRSLFSMMVERQIMSRLLPRVKGTRVQIEPSLWRLLMFCLDGLGDTIPPLDNESYERALQVAQSNQQWGTSEPIVYPVAARAVVGILDVVREHGVYPEPIR